MLLLSAELRPVDRYEANVLNKITEKSGAVATIAAIIALKRWSIPAGGLGAGAIASLGKARGWW